MLHVDRLNGARRKDVAHATMRLLNRLQDTPEEIQVLSATVLFMKVAAAYGIAGRKALEVATRILAEANEQQDAGFFVLDLYTKGELNKGR